MKSLGRKKAKNGNPSVALSPSKQDICTSIHQTDLQKSHIYAWFCIGGILEIISLCFLAMSFKFNVAGKQNFAPKSMEFAVCCIVGAIGLLFLLAAIICILIVTRKAKKLKAELAKLKS